MNAVHKYGAFELQRVFSLLFSNMRTSHWEEPIFQLIGGQSVSAIEFQVHWPL